MTANNPTPQEQTASPEAGNAPAPAKGKLSDYLKHIELAERAKFSGDLMKAITEYHAALEIRPHMFHPNLHVAQLYRDVGLTGDALLYFEKAYELQPDNVAVLTQIAELVYISGNRDGAKGVLCHALAIDDHYTPAIIALSELLAKDGQYDRAIELMQAAIQGDEKNAPLWVAIGIVMHLKGDTDNAKIFYEEALRLDPASEIARHNMDRIEKGEALEAQPAG